MSPEQRGQTQTESKNSLFPRETERSYGLAPPTLNVLSGRMAAEFWTGHIKKTYSHVHSLKLASPA